MTQQKQISTDKNKYNFYISYWESYKMLPKDSEKVEFIEIINKVHFFEEHIDNIKPKSANVNLLFASIKHSLKASIQGYCDKKQLDYNSMFNTPLVTPLPTPLATINKEQQVINNKEKKKTLSSEEVVSFWNSLASDNNLPTIKTLTTSRKQHLSSRIKEVKDFEEFKEVVSFNISNSKFLTGDNTRNWKVDFDWVVNPNNFIKIIEGKYTNKNTSSQNINDGIDYELLKKLEGNI